MTETKGQNWQNVQEAALPVTGSVARATNEVIMAKVDQHLNAPLRLFATFPTPNAVLNIGAGKIEVGDGAARVSPPSDDTLLEYLGAAINLTTAAITGSGTVTRDGAAFSLPTTTVSRYRRLFLVYKSVGNSVDVSFDSSSVGYVDLNVLRSTEDPGVKFSAMDGIPLGYIDLQCFNGSNHLKTANSATNIIENKVGSDNVLFRIGSGAGSGSGGDSSFKLQSIASNVATIKKGSYRLVSGVELYIAANLSVNLLTAPLSGVVSPANSTHYYLYIDLQTLPTSTLVGTSDRKIQVIAASNFVVLATDPDATNLGRYLPIASLKTNGSGSYTAFENGPAKLHVMSPVTVSPIVQTIGPRSIGAVGSVANAQGALVDGDFPNAANAAAFLLDTNANKTAGTATAAWTVNGTPSFSTKGLFGYENILNFDGFDDYLSSTQAFFQTTSFTWGSWVKTDSSVTTTQTLFESGRSNDNNGAYVFIDSGRVRFRAGHGGSTSTVDVPVNFKVDEWNHVAVAFTTGTNLMQVFINGQLSGSGTATGAITYGNTNTYVGSDAASRDFKGVMTDLFKSSDVMTAAQVNAIYSKRFTNNAQIAAGHFLASDSFPLTSLTNKASFWNFQSNSTDGSSNAKNLTNNGSIPFTGLGLFGAADAAVLLASASRSFSYDTDAYFNTGPNVPFAFGGWFAANDWTPAGNRMHLASVATDTPQAGWMITLESNNLIFSVPIDDIELNSFSIPATGFADGSFHHIAISYDGSSIWKFYVDGVVVGSVIQANITVLANLLRIGACFALAQEFFSGRVNSAFFIKNYNTSDADIRKLYSARIDLSDTSVLPANQKWEAYHEAEDGKLVNEYDTGWLVDKKADKIYVDFGGASGNKVTLRLSDLMMSTRTIPTRDKRIVFTSTPGATVAHGLPEMPTGIALFHDELADGKWAPLNASNHVKVDATNFYFAGFDSLLVDGTHPVLVVASVAPIALAADKRSLDNFTPNVVEVTSARTAVNGDVVILKTGAGSQTLPASPAVGDTVIFMDGGIGLLANNVTVLRNGQSIMGAASDLTLDLDNSIWKLVFVGGSRGWQVF